MSTIRQYHKAYTCMVVWLSVIHFLFDHEDLVPLVSKSVAAVRAYYDYSQSHK